MDILTIEIHVIPAKRQELLQTLHELAPLKRKEKGFIDSRVQIDARDGNRLTLVEEWETRDALNAYMQSELFQILCGALKLLTASADMTFRTVEGTSNPGRCINSCESNQTGTTLKGG
jgi:quinol monooxygenase YgiN